MLWNHGLIMEPGNKTKFVAQDQIQKGPLVAASGTQ